MNDISRNRRRNPGRIWFKGLAVLAAVLLGWRFVFAADGPREVVRVACAKGGSIDLLLSVYTHPLDFEQGGSVGYELTYAPEAGESEPIYNDNFSLHDHHGLVSAPYVSWRFDGTNFSGPNPSHTYAPLPQSGPVRVFKSEAQAGTLPNPQSLDFMNIFLDTRKVPQPHFEIMADCLAAHEAELDRALADMRNKIPSPLGRFYHPLRLGGIFYGPPPYAEPSYAKAVKDQLSASVIPASGGFRLFRGRAATGVIDGHRIELSLTEGGEIEVRRDGSRVSFNAMGEGDQPGISRNGWQIYIGRGRCSDRNSECGEDIEMVDEREDQSDWFLIFRQFGPTVWGQTAVPSPFSP